MQFRTEVEIKQSKNQISHQTTIMMLGSCFVENIGEKLKSLKFNTFINPTGIIFNPASIADTVERLISQKPYTQEELFYDRECWNSFAHHSRFSHASAEKALNNMNDMFLAASINLKNADVLVFTFGTAWVYWHKELENIVANCHKVPANAFERRLLYVDEIVSRYQNLTQRILEINPHIRFIYSISPVRHLKDGADGNQLSKSILKIAVHQLIQDQTSEYFPAYEILLDELRDYRFYATDMVHPSEVAIDYIFEKFGNTYFSNETLQLNKEIQDIITATQHRPYNPNSEAHKSFCNSLLKRIDSLQKSHFHLDFSSEKEKLQSQI